MLYYNCGENQKKEVHDSWVWLKQGVSAGVVMKARTGELCRIEVRILIPSSGGLSPAPQTPHQIGRASCRERVSSPV